MSGFWGDEKRRPGPLPQGRPPALAIRLVIAAVGVLLIGKVHNHIVLGLLVLLIGLGGVYTTVRLNQQRVDEQRYLRGPGWWIGVLISKTSVPVARVIWGAISAGICALGIASLVLSHHR